MLNAKEDIWNFIFNNSFMDGLNNEVLGIAGSVSMSVGVACLPAFPVGTVVGLGLIGFGLYSTYYADDLNRGITDQRLAHFGLDVGLSLIPGVGSELKMGKIVLSKGTKEISSKIVTRNSFAFEKYLVEKGETEVLYNGLSRTSIKYGTLDHAVDMVWDLTKENIYKDLRNNYLYYKPIHYAFNVYYNDYNFNDAIWDTLDTSI